MLGKSCFVEVALVSKRQRRLEAVAQLQGEGRGWLALRVEVRHWVGRVGRCDTAGQAQGERHGQRTDRVHADSMMVADRREASHVSPVGPAPSRSCGILREIH